MGRLTPSFSAFQSATCSGALGGELGFHPSGRDQVAGMSRVLGDLHLATEPAVISFGFLLLPNEVTHEVAQQPGAGTVTPLGRFGELVFEVFIDAEGDGRFAPGLAPMCYSVITW